MSVSVSVKLHAPCFAAGERVSATVTLSCAGAAPGSSLSYLVAQVSGRWTGDSAWIRASPHATAADPESGALDLHIHPRESQWDAALDDANRVGGGGRAGYSGIIFRSAPLVVCMDEPVPAEAFTAFNVHCVLPDTLPATLRGTAVRYSYSFIVVAAMQGKEPQFVRVPFRVVTPEGTRHDRIIPVPTPRKTGPSPSSFLEESPGYALSMGAVLAKHPPPDDVDVALAICPNGRLTNFSTDEDLWKRDSGAGRDEETPLNFMHYVPPSPRTPISPSTPGASGPQAISLNQRARPSALPMYQISRGSLSLARMCLPKRVHHLGETLTAVFDFRDGATRCCRLSARLECQEIVQPAHALGTKHGEAGAQGIIFRKVFGEHSEFVMLNRNTHVTFSIPHDAPVTFATSAVHVRWLIHFVFLIPKEDEEQGSQGTVENGANADPVAGRNPGQGGQNGSSAGAGGQVGADDDEGNEDDADSTAPLLAGVRLQENGVKSVSTEIPGWEGGAWRGDDPNDWKQLPKRDTDALQWTLPLTVTSRQGSQWGACSHSLLQLNC